MGDPGELENLADQAPELVGVMTGRLDGIEVLARSKAVEAEAVEIDPEMEERLRNLGY
jgi:hypothetical protein